ncbi:MAG: metallophosphoesterase family protein [Aliishimia sp.]
MSNPIYAVGDIHGQLGELQRVLALIEADGGPEAHVVFLGDYTDRGPDSRGVLDVLIEGQTQDRNWICLMGNHDQMFSLFMQNPPQSDPYLMAELYWLHPRLGGDTTMASYGVQVEGTRRVKDIHAEALKSVPQSHLDFLSNLQLTFETDRLFFAHAGIRPEVPLATQSHEDLIWIRQEFHSYTDAHPKLIVHGHTPIDTPTHYGNRMNLDAGAGYGKPLSACVFDGDACYLLTQSGRVLLKPVFS